MKIKSLTTENFKSSPNQKLDFKKLNVFVGPNGTGKTSTQEALRYALCGKLPENPVQINKEFLSTSITLDDAYGTTIQRIFYLPPSYMIDGKEVTEKKFVQKVEEYRNLCEQTGVGPTLGQKYNPFFADKDESMLWEFLHDGTTRSCRLDGIKELEIALYNGTVLYRRCSKPSKCLVNGKSASASKCTEVLKNHALDSHASVNMNALDIVTSSEVMRAMNMDDFSKFLLGILPITVDFKRLCDLCHLTEKEVAVLEPFFPQTPEPISIADIRSACALLVETRVRIGRKADMYKKRMIYDGQLPVPDVESVQSRLEEVNQNIGKAAQIEKAWAEYDKQLQARQKSLANYQRWVAEYNNIRYEQFEPGMMQKLKDQEDSLRKSQIEQLQVVSGAKPKAAAIQSMLENLKSTICPLCDTLVCKTDKQDCADDLRKKLAEYEYTIKMAEAKAKSCEEDIKVLMEKQEKVHQNHMLYEKKLNLYKQILSLKETLLPEPQKPAAIPDTDKLKERAKKLESHFRSISVFEECKKTAKEFEKENAEYDLYSVLIKKCDAKNGILVKTLLSILLEPFNTHINRFLELIYPDMQMAFEVHDKGLKILCKPHGRTDFLSMDSLSTGEHILATFALMDMIAGISNTRIISFDWMESLDAGTLAALLYLLQKPEIQERYDHVFLAVVDHDSIVKELELITQLNIIHF